MISAEKNINIEKYSPKNGYLKAEAASRFNLVVFAPKRMSKRLSQKEVDIVTLLGYGYDQSEISTMLFMSKNTVWVHIQKLKWKFDARTVGQLIWIILRNNLLETLEK